MMKNAERILAAYALAEPWQEDHDDALRCFEAEEFLAVGNLAYDLLTYVETTWQDRVAAGLIPFNDEDDRQLGALYRIWVEASERKLDEIQTLTRKGYDLQGDETFLAHLEEARSLLEARSLEAEMRPIEEILPLVQGNPRPERYGK